MTHTPGPWEIFGEDNGGLPVIRIEVSERDICEVRGVWDREYITQELDRESHANARLISAAPDLLEALERWRDRLGSPGDVDLQTLLHMTDAAIAKARGEG